MGCPFTHWSVRKLLAYRARNDDRRIQIGLERLRQILREHHISFQRTRTWKESTDPDKDAKLDRIDYVTSHFLDRCFAFDQFGPLSIRPCHGSTWARESQPVRLPATYHRTHGIRYFHGCYSLGDDQLWGVNRRRKGGDHSLSALKSIRAARPDGAPIYVIMDNLSANKTPAVRAWAARNKVELCLTPTSASWANPSRLSSVRCAPSRWAPLITRIIRPWPDDCRHICAGATPTPATPTCSQHNVANAAGSAANATNAGADHERHDPVNVHGQRTRGCDGRGRCPSPVRPSSGGCRLPARVCSGRPGGSRSRSAHRGGRRPAAARPRCWR